MPHNNLSAAGECLSQTGSPVTSEVCRSLYAGMTGVSGGGGFLIGGAGRRGKFTNYLGRGRDGNAQYAFWGGVVVCEELSTYSHACQADIPGGGKSQYQSQGSLEARLSRFGSSKYSRGRKRPLLDIPSDPLRRQSRNGPMKPTWWDQREDRGSFPGRESAHAKPRYRKQDS